MTDATDVALIPAERVALTAARSAALDGREVGPNTATALIMTVERLADDLGASRAQLVEAIDAVHQGLHKGHGTLAVLARLTEIADAAGVRDQVIDAQEAWS